MIRLKYIVKYENASINRGINRREIVAFVDIAKISRREIFPVYCTVSFTVDHIYVQLSCSL